jgi:hypothetical protein
VQSPPAVLFVMLAGQLVRAGPSRSLIVTVNVQALVLPLVSVAVQVTVVTPLANVEPLAGTQATKTPGQLSVAEGSLQVTFVFEHVPESVLPVMFDGHEPITGFSVSFTVTVKEQVEKKPTLFVAPQFTVVVPLGKVEPLAGLQTTAGLQLPLTDGMKFTTWSQVPEAVFVVMFAGQVNAGVSQTV